MGVLIKMITKNEGKENVKQLKALVDKYIHENKKFVINKIKQEQK